MPSAAIYIYYIHYRDSNRHQAQLVWHPKQKGSNMMTSSNGNIFRVTGPLCGEFTDLRWNPLTKPVTRSFDVVFDLRLDKRLSKQSWGWWFETPSCSLWRHCNVIISHTARSPDNTNQYNKILNAAHMMTSWHGNSFSIPFVNTLRPRQNGRHFPDDFKCFSWMKMYEFRLDQIMLGADLHTMVIYVLILKYIDISWGNLWSRQLTLMPPQTISEKSQFCQK